MATPESSRAGSLSGLWFVFKQDGHKISAHVSGLTAKEEVFVDDALVAHRRKVSLKSIHSVRAGDREYELHLTVRNAALGIVECALIHDGNVVAAQRANYRSNVPPAMHAVTIGSAALAVYATYRFSAASWWPTAALASMAALSMAWSIHRGKYTIEPSSIESPSEA